MDIWNISPLGDVWTPETGNWPAGASKPIEDEELAASLLEQTENFTSTNPEAAPAAVAAPDDTPPSAPADDTTHPEGQ